MFHLHIEDSVSDQFTLLRYLHDATHIKQPTAMAATWGMSFDRTTSKENSVCKGEEDHEC